ncbi:MAG: methionine ABC transporter substrate-binding lipoprotein MetQ [Chthoniobacterales bacterium]|nr:methionine ABC transporter substrate-binding lipoprotein MetQ [Chthoniobacterales bacterium]
MKLLIITTILSTFFLCACSKKQKGNVVKVGVVAGREAELMETVTQVAKEQFGLTVETVVFSDYVTPNIALADGSLDVNVFQHLPYLKAMMKDRGYPLVPVGNAFIYPLAGYSQKIKQLSDLKEGATIALPNDPTNLARSLMLLQKQGLLELKPEADCTATTADVISNPKNLKLLELEAPQLPRSLQDVDLAVINTTYASQINLFPLRDGLFVEEKDSPYVNVIVARENNCHEKKIQDFVKAYQSDDVFKRAQELFQGNVVKGW